MDVRYWSLGLLEALIRKGRFDHGPLLATCFPTKLSIIQAT